MLTMLDYRRQVKGDAPQGQFIRVKHLNVIWTVFKLMHAGRKYLHIAIFVL